MGLLIPTGCICTDLVKMSGIVPFIILHFSMLMQALYPKAADE